MLTNTIFNSYTCKLLAGVQRSTQPYITLTKHRIGPTNHSEAAFPECPEHTSHVDTLS